MAVYTRIDNALDWRGNGRLEGPRTNNYGDTFWRVVTYEGRVVGEREMNGSSDSDFYATVWAEGADAPHEVQWGTTRFPTYDNGCSVDASPELQQRYRAHLDAGIRAARAERHRVELATPRKGKVVECIKASRGKDAPPKGACGTVIWVGAPRYRNSGLRVGFKTTEGIVYFCAASYIKVRSQGEHAPALVQATL